MRREKYFKTTKGKATLRVMLSKYLEGLNNKKNEPDKDKGTVSRLRTACDRPVNVIPFEMRGEIDGFETPVINVTSCRSVANEGAVHKQTIAIIR